MCMPGRPGVAGCGFPAMAYRKGSGLGEESMGEGEEGGGDEGWSEPAASNTARGRPRPIDADDGQQGCQEGECEQPVDGEW